MAVYMQDLGANPETWGAGSVIRVPKIEGPLTLWCRDFAVSLFQRFSTSTGKVIRMELYLALLREQGLARIAEMKLSPQGWRPA